jgi:hypothetical protein
MSFLGRLFGSAPPAPPPDPLAVTIAPDLAAALAPPGTSLQAAVDAALRRLADAERRAAEAGTEGAAGKIPFWLRRDQGGAGDMEDQLRDRIAQRHPAGEEEP